MHAPVVLGEEVFAVEVVVAAVAVAGAGQAVARVAAVEAQLEVLG